MTEGEKYAKYGNFYFLDDLSNLLQMSYPLSIIKLALYDNHYSMHLNLAKLFLYPDFKEYHNEWKAALRKGYESIPKNKRTGKFPTKKQILDYIWNNNTDSLEDHHKLILSDILFVHRDLPKRGEGSDNEFFLFAQKYAIWLAEQLSKKGTISEQEVSEKIDSLLAEKDS